jgi:hypothetical protein
VFKVKDSIGYVNRYVEMIRDELAFVISRNCVAEINSGVIMRNAAFR